MLCGVISALRGEIQTVPQGQGCVSVLSSSGWRREGMRSPCALGLFCLPGSRASRELPSDPLICLVSGPGDPQSHQGLNLCPWLLSWVNPSRGHPWAHPMTPTMERGSLLTRAQGRRRGALGPLSCSLSLRMFPICSHESSLGSTSTFGRLSWKSDLVTGISCHSEDDVRTACSDQCIEAGLLVTVSYAGLRCP